MNAIIDTSKYISELDTKRFGFNIAKIKSFNVNIEDLLQKLANENVKLVMCRVPVENIKQINTFEKAGFETKDFQVTYRFDIKNHDQSYLIANKNVIVRKFVAKDIPHLQKIAKESFFDYGHYAIDEKLDKGKCNEIYVDWITRSCLDSNVADEVFVAENNGKIAGFLSFKIYQDENLRYAAGGIGAVGKNFRNLNVFKSLTAKGLDWGKENSLDWVEHNVLINNYPVNKSFVRSGFYIYKSFINMHNWIK